MRRARRSSTPHSPRPESDCFPLGFMWVKRLIKNEEILTLNHRQTHDRTINEKPCETDISRPNFAPRFRRHGSVRIRPFAVQRKAINSRRFAGSTTTGYSGPALAFNVLFPNKQPMDETPFASVAGFTGMLHRKLPAKSTASGSADGPACTQTATSVFQTRFLRPKNPNRLPMVCIRPHVRT